MPALTDIESKIFSSKDFRLENGQILPVLELAYETYGTLSATRDNAVLAVHGYTSSHHAAGRNAKGKQGRGVAEGAAGWFDGLIGPGKAVDTDKYFVISVNALGSAHGSTGPNTTDPRTSKPYGPTFPEITMRDIVAAEKLTEAGRAPRLRALLAHAEQWAPAFTIRGGTNEILRGVIARGIGLR